MPALKIPIVVTVIACFTLGTFFSIPAADPMPSNVNYYAQEVASDSGKIGKDFYPLLVKADSNKDWWEWSFRQLEADKKNSKVKVDSVFKNTTLKKNYDSKTGDGAANSDSLNKVCHYVFKQKTTAEITDTKADSDFAKSFWKYCTAVQFKPITIKESVDAKKPHPYKSKLGETHQSTLIATTTNNKFWDNKNTWFKSQTVNDAFFKPFKDGKDKTLSEACESAYKAEGVESSNATAQKPIKTDLDKYCGLKVS